jgi:hypothetical protein
MLLHTNLGYNLIFESNYPILNGGVKKISWSGSYNKPGKEENGQSQLTYHRPDALIAGRAKGRVKNGGEKDSYYG